MGKVVNNSYTYYLRVLMANTKYIYRSIDDLVDFIGKSKFDKFLKNHDLLNSNEKFQKVDFIKGSILIINLK